MTFTEEFLTKCSVVLHRINPKEIDKVIDILANLEGRLFVIGSGGGAGHASHAVCDFRKLCNIEAYAPYDNLSELTAVINDAGWDVSIENWLRESRLNHKDCVFVFSVGGGNKNVSPNIVNALNFAVERDAWITGIVGKNGGYTKEVADALIIVPEIEPITPLTEGFQSVLWHLIVSSPRLAKNKTVW